MTLERKKQTPVCMFLSKRGRPTGGKKWTWTRPFARPRPSSTSDEGGSVVPNSRLITAVIWISRIPMDITGPLGSTQTTTTATAMRQKTRPPRNQTRAEWEMEWKARRKRWELWRAIVSIMSGELRKLEWVRGSNTSHGASGMRPRQIFERARVTAQPAQCHVMAYL